MNPPVKAAFRMDGVTLPLTTIHPIRQVKPTDHAFGKYNAVKSSIREVGVIEPLIVHPQPGSKDLYYLLDGHMRLKALQELGITDAFCLISTDADPFTYNDKLFVTIARNVCPDSTRNHSNITYYRRCSLCNVCKSALAIIQINVTGRRDPILTWRTASANKQICKSIMIKIISSGNAGVHSTCRESRC